MSTTQPAGKIEADAGRVTPVSAPADQRADVVALAEALRQLAQRRANRAPACRLVGTDGTEMPLPDSVFRLLARAVEVLVSGNAIALVPVGKELTTQEAADLLNVSRQYLVRLLDDERIPCTKTGKHRRLQVDDVLAFKQTRDRQRKAKLDELTRLRRGGWRLRRA